MPRLFDRNGITLQYPDNWEMEDDWSIDGGTIVLRSPDTAFFLLSLHPDIDDPAELAEEVLDTMREEYPGLEAETVVDSVAGQPAVGHNIDFVALDLTNTARTRCLLGRQGAIVLLSQATDLDLPKHDQVLRAIQASITIDDE